MKSNKILALFGSAFLLTIGLWAVYSWMADEGVSAQPQAKPYTPTQILQNQRLERPVRTRIVGGNYYILDARAHRMVVLDSSERFLRQIGRLGRGPQEFNDPTDFAIGPAGNIYMFEAGNQRVTILGPDGARVGGFSAPELSLAIAVNSQGEIILNQPGKGSLVTVYAPNGDVKRRFGELHTPPATFPPHPPDDKKETYNRVSFALDGSDNIYVAWLFEARVQKYTAAGELVWDVELAGKEVDRFKERARANAGYYKYNGATIILSGVAYDSSSNLVYVLFPSRTLYVLDQKGNKLAAFMDVRENVWPFHSVTATGDGSFLFTDTSNGVHSISGLRP